jgi:chromosome transmission fidelity protein 8
MLIPITITSPSTASLPVQLTKLGNDELVLIELQGSLDVECTDNSERDGQIVGTFQLDEGSVSF